MRTVESFTDAVKKKNLQPGETIQSLLFLSMPQDWMAGNHRLRVVDSAGEESLIAITFDCSAPNANAQAQAAVWKVLKTGVNISKSVLETQKVHNYWAATAKRCEREGCNSKRTPSGNAPKPAP